MKAAKPIEPLNRFLSSVQNGLLACVIALLLSSCQSTQSSSSSSSTSSPSTSSSSQSSQSASSSASSSSDSESSSDAEQAPSAEGQSGSEEPDEDSMANDTSEDLPPDSGASPGAPGSGVLSEEEAVAVLDEQLDKSIAVFDGMIINERATVQSNESEFPDDEDGFFGDDDPLFEEADISEDSDGNGVPASPTEGRGSVLSDTNAKVGDGTLVSGRGSVQSSKADVRVPEDIPDGSDDDIVARQIREAAMKEQDPVLREKLWEEYRKYKRGQ